MRIKGARDAKDRTKGKEQEGKEQGMLGWDLGMNG